MAETRQVLHGDTARSVRHDQQRSSDSPAARVEVVPRRTRVKICGITRPADGVAAAELGADAIGLVFYPPSPRLVSVERAAEIAAELPPFVTVVALFVNAARDDVRRLLEHVPVDVLQFHGTEPPGECAGHGRAYIKAVGVKEGVDVAAAAREHARAQALLVDVYDRERWGGSGSTFDWSLLGSEVTKPLVLAGGLHAGNVAEAVQQVRPWAVDVSGGVEREKGIKDPAKIAAFIRSVQRVAASGA